MTDNEITKNSGEINSNKIKAIYPHIVVSGDVDKPYYSIQWYDIEKKTMFDGYASYELKFVREWLQENFEVVETDIDNLINRQQAEIESIKKFVVQLTYDLRTNMTSVTRYVKHKKENKPKHIKMQYFNQRHIEYQKLAEKAVNNILKCLNENQELRNVEKLCKRNGG